MLSSFCLILASKLDGPLDGSRLTLSSNSASEVALAFLTLFPFLFVGFLSIVLSFSLVSKRVYPQFPNCESFLILLGRYLTFQRMEFVICLGAYSVC